MTSRALRGALLLAASTSVWASACDPWWRAKGHLVDDSGAPVAGATTTLECPSSTTDVRTSDAAGEFELGSIGDAADCTVAIEKKGFVTRRVRTLDLCYRASGRRGYDTACKRGEGKIVLTRSPVAPAPAPK